MDLRSVSPRRTSREEFTMRTIELRGGPLDGKRAQVHDHVREYQATMIPPLIYRVWVETVYGTPDGVVFFDYEGQRSPETMMGR